jgi:hypothetical protein
VSRYRLVVMASPVRGREQECERWYQEVHLPEMVALPGILSAQRYQRAANLREGSETYPYLTIYEVEADDIQSVVQRITETAEAGGFDMSGAIDREGTYAVFYQACGPEVTAAE